MANQRYVLEFSLKDVGDSLKAGKKDADALRGSLDSIIKASNKASSSGGKGGWKNAIMGGDAYDVARGSAGATGASGRDFANQARGLDGLVRLYATYAANLFAAGAAFRALSDAADTSNMVQGMNQLGAVSGLALGNIAKNLVSVTDGAISMREAMEATTKGTAAGLSSKQMEQLGQVANKASKALGVAMPDAISRLTRGISKLEPELLDELGLFTKIGPATDDYARSIGKTAAQLTDFERRQAFANAVLKEGNDKFNAIDIPANPYDKLLASLKDLSFTALELINKALVPLVNVLSQNPGILLGVLTAIGATIVKSAIPALGHYRENLKKTTEASRQAFTQMYNNQQIAFSNLAADQAAMAERTFRKSKDTQDRLQALSKEGKTFSKGTKVDYAGLASKDPFELTANEIKSLDARARNLASRNAEEAERLRKHVANLKAIRAESANIGDVAASKTIESSEKFWSTAFANDRINKQKLITLTSQSIRSNVAETQSLLGMRAAWQKLNQDLDAAQKGFFKVQTGIDENGKAITQTAPKLNSLQAGYTKFAGGLGIVLQKIGTTVQAFGVAGQVAAALAGAFYLVDAALTKVEKEQDAFTKAMNGSSDAIDNTTRTLDALAKQPGIASSSIQGFLALANASQTTTGAIETQIDATKKLLQALNNSWWDRAKNNIAGLFGKDAASESAKNLANTVESQLKVFRAAGLGDQAESSFKKAIGVSSLDVDTLTTAFKNGTAAQDAFAKSNKALDAKLAESNANLQSFKTSTEALTKAYDEFIQSTASSNPMFKIGAALEDVSAIMQKIGSSDIQDINAAFNDLADNPKKIAQFGKAFIDQFVAIRQEFKTTLQDYAAYGQSIAAIQAQIDLKTEQKKNAKATVTRRVGGVAVQGESVEQKKQKLSDEIALLQKSKKTVTELQLGLNTEVFAKAKDLFTKGITDSFEKGSKLIEIAMGQASQKAALSIAQAGVGALTGQQAAQETGRIKQEELKIQMQQVQSTIDLIASNALLTATMTESNALMADAQARKDGAPSEVRSETSAALLGAQIVKKAMGNLSEGKLKASELDTVLTGNAQVDKYIKQQLLPLKRQTAQQQATQTELGGKQKATEIETARSEALGRLEDLSKQRNLVNDINQQISSRLDILASIDTLNGAERAQEKSSLENLILINRQQQERDVYETAINNALALRTTKGDEEAAKQRKLLNLVKTRQNFENDNKALVDRVKFKAAELDAAIKLNALNEALLDQDIARLGVISTLIGFSSEQNVSETARLENLKLENKFALERKKIEDEIYILRSDATRDNSKSIALQEVNLALVTARQEKEKDNKGLQDALKLLEARFNFEQKIAGFRKTAADAQGQQAEDELNYKKELGLVTSEQYAKEKASLDRAKVGRETAMEQSNIDKEIAKKALLESKIADIEASGDSALAGDYEAVNKMTEAINGQSAALKATNDQKMNAINLNEKLADKMTGFSKIVEGSFQSMGDALAEFARTGKLDFKGLVDQMLVDLIRFEMRAQMSSLYSSMGGLGGMLNWGVSLFTGTPPTPKAKGGVYEAGLETFAKGGMFTNSIVNEPTLFKFAKGTGMMGEAGPEAIMPLKRDSNGNLGVRGPNYNGGGNVDVVVNNYGNQKATTKETMDSRGNRRIEVIVGDIVAGELNRVGSNTQQAMSASYGTSPLVARR